MNRDRRLAGLHVLDLGCGTGMLAIGAALLGARVTGVDIDQGALDVATASAELARVASRTTWVCSDVADFAQTERFDAVVMNPPFGAQRANRGGDRIFYDQARTHTTGAIWFLAPPVSEGFLRGYARDAGGSVEKVGEWSFPLPATMAHHARDIKTLRVGGYRMEFPPD
jgi:putative methylase